MQSSCKIKGNAWDKIEVQEIYQFTWTIFLAVQKAYPYVKKQRTKTGNRSRPVTVHKGKNSKKPYQDKGAIVSVDIVNLGNQKKAGSKKEGWEQNQGRTRPEILLIFVFKMIASVMYAYCASSKQQNLNAISDLNGLLFVQLLLVC